MALRKKTGGQDDVFPFSKKKKKKEEGSDSRALDCKLG